jgi:hypothetical protein
VSPATTRHAEPDQICADAIDLARGAAEEVGPGQIGAHLGTETEGDRVVTHLFACLSPAYVGWRWAVTVTRAARSKQVTVSESLLLPGPDALIAPDWVPWTERVRPGDLKAGDLMPASADDERLIPAVAIDGADGLLDWDEGNALGLGSDLPGGVLPGADPSAATSGADWADSGADEPDAGPAEPSARRTETGLRPTRVLSAIGRDETAVRWYAGQPGPGTALASAAPGHCLTCGFLVRLSGPLGRVFGVCANEFAPDDGKVVSVDHGCGAHSDAGTAADSAGDAAVPAIDELGYDMMTAGAALPESVLETLDHELL